MNPRRFQRLRRALARRQPDLTVLLENVHKPHNFSAVLRSADAAGVFEAHAVAPDGNLALSHMSSGGSRRWVRVRCHDRLATALEAVAGFRLLAAHPSRRATDFRQVDYTRPVAILFGQEKDGLTAEALAAADELVSIPMMGMVASLNVSVAAALILFEAQRQRAAAGLYERSRLDTRVFEATLFEWAHPEVAGYCRRRRLAYPRLDPEGEILDPIP